MIQIGLKAKLSVLIGLVLTIVMGLWSLVILIDERDFLISKHEDIARAIIKSYSGSLTNTLMYEEMGVLPFEGTLENYIEQIARQENLPIKYVGILSKEFETIANNKQVAYGANYHNSIVAESARKRDSALGIVDHPQDGWILEVVEPLRIAGKLWGYIVIVFDAEIIRAKIHNLFSYLLVTTALVILIGVVAVYFVSDRLTKSLKEMVTVIDHYDIRHSKVLSLPRSNDEIGYLIGSFAQMQNRLYTSRRDLEKAQKETYHAEKLASIGQLAAGVAHEINNPLMGLKNCVKTMRSEPDNLEQNSEYLELMQEGTEKIESVVGKLLEFSHKKTRKTAEIDIGASIDRLLKLVGFKLSNNMIETEVDIDSSLCGVSGDSQLLEEVFMNIIINAIDAMPGGGSLSISAMNISADNISIRFKDDGIGIAPAAADKVFDPFFTTKDIGKGTGLGLSVSKRIVEEHEGTLTFTSNVGQGTTFYVQLPVKGGKTVETMW